jgi:hypothetical protein
MISHIKQPTPFSCGQTCLAMLTNVSPYEVMLEIGTEGTTKSHHLISYLRSHGFTCSSKLIPLKFFKAMPEIFIGKLVANGRKVGWHWVLWANARFYDPEKPEVNSIEHLSGKITSIIKIFRS